MEKDIAQCEKNKHNEMDNFKICSFTIIRIKFNFKKIHLNDDIILDLISKFCSSHIKETKV